MSSVPQTAATTFAFFLYQSFLYGLNQPNLALQLILLTVQVRRDDTHYIFRRPLQGLWAPSGGFSPSSSSGVVIEEEEDRREGKGRRCWLKGQNCFNNLPYWRFCTRMI